MVTNPPASAEDAGDTGSAPGLGRSPGGGNSNPVLYSCVENPMDTGAWLATVHGVAESDMTEHSCTHVRLQWEAVIFFIHFTVKALHVDNLN